MTNTSSLDGTFHAIHMLSLKRLVPEAGELLIQHGCTLHEQEHEETLIVFPEGSKRQTIWPRTISERYRILLPDGQELRQIFDRIQNTNQLLIVLDKK